MSGTRLLRTEAVSGEGSSDEEYINVEDATDSEDEEEWRRAGALADKYMMWHPPKMTRALAKDSDEVEIERENVPVKAWILSFILLASPFSWYLLVAVQGCGGCAIEGLLKDEDWCVLIVAFAYLAYLIEALCFSPTSAYLTNVCSEQAFHKYIEKVQSSNPQIQFTIQNWHNETRVEYVSDGENGGHLETRTERVNTHYAEMYYGIQGHTDETLSPQQIIAMFHLLHDHGNLKKGVNTGDINFVVKDTGEEVLLLLCQFPLDYYPRDNEVQSHHSRSKEAFYHSNTTDVYQDKDEKHSLDFHGYTKRMMVILSSAGSDRTTRPWWMDYWVFALCSVFFMTIPYRLCLFAKCTAKKWKVTKHYSNKDAGTFTGDPENTMKKSHNPHLAAVMNAGKNLHIKREEGDDEGDLGEYEEFHVHLLGDEIAEVNTDLPAYWVHQDVRTSFDTKEAVSPEFEKKIQQLLDKTWKDKATRDREGEIPKRLKMLSCHRIEDCEMWLRYAHKRAELAAARGSFTPITSLEGSGEVKTMALLDPQLRSQLVEDMNEVYLFHGTSPGGAMGIREDGFKLSLAGSNVGTMFGRGVYLAEASSKCDEYAKTDDSGHYEGIYGLLLCRVTCGEIFRITKSNIPVIEKALASGEYDTVLGDREAAVGTYREFVVFDEHQIYPEYVVLYRKVFEDDAEA